MALSLPQNAASPDLLQRVENECRFIARQPIFDAAQKVRAYELLFRSSRAATCIAPDANAATCSTIDLSLLIDSDALTDGLPAYINCTRELLVNGTVRAIPRDRAVLEILEDVPPDPEVLEACTDLRRSGYKLALDDYTGSPDRDAFLEFCEIIKVDFILATPSQREKIATRLRRRGNILLAEKVETREEFKSALNMGYQLFQGFFFCKPEVISTQDVPCLQPVYMELLQETHSSEFDIARIENIIRREPSLCYRLLRYLNSASFGLYPVRSIRHALTLIGQVELQKWASINMAIALAGPRSSELICNALHRARFCELLSYPNSGPHPNESFLAGVFSLIDAMLNQPISSIVELLPVSPAVKNALVSRTGHLASQLNLATACERADWVAFADSCRELRLDEKHVWEQYAEARVWVRGITRLLS